MQIQNTRTGSSPLAAFLLVFALLLVCGCTTTPPKRWENVAILNIPYERVWSEVVAFNRNLAPGTTVDELHGTVQTPDVCIDLEEFPFEQYAREPGVFHDWATRRFNTRYNIRKLSEGKTEVSVVSQFTAYSDDAGRWLVWPSNGKHEETMVSKLRDSLQQGTNTTAR